MVELGCGMGKQGKEGNIGKDKVQRSVKNIKLKCTSLEGFLKYAYYI